MESLFGPPISTYTAQQAAEDGVLVPISARDAVTRSVWEWLATKTPMSSQPPTCWPVDMMGWFGADRISKTEALKIVAEHGKDAQAEFETRIRDRKALALARGLVERDKRKAQRVEDAGSILEIYAEEHGGVIHGLIERSAEGLSVLRPMVTMYLRPNELGGVTLMFPEDN